MSVPGSPFVSRGHGHVTPRPDGFKARCAGPGLCSTCNRELAAKAASDAPLKNEPPDPTPKPAPNDARDAEITRLKTGIQRYLDGDYDHPRKYRPNKCPHGTPYSQPCEICTDNHFQKLLDGTQ